MAQDIKQKIVLEGEKEYRQALRDAQRNLRTLRSELKAETAELGRNATEQQKAETRAKNLKKQIAEQEKIVKTYTEALKETREKYGDNEDAIAKWEQKLNEARAALANMKNDLQGVDQGMKGITGSADTAVIATKSVADSLEKLSGIGETISSSIESVFTGLISTVSSAIGEVWAQITDLAARSNGLVDLAGFWNTDVTTIQKYQGAVSAASGSLEDLNQIVTKINSGDAKKITELTGISGEIYEDQWAYAMAVMDAMSQMDTKTRNATAFDLFGGKQATKAFDLLNDWQKVQAELATFDVTQGGYGLTEEELQQMSDLCDNVNKLEQSWKSLKDKATVKLFGSLSMDLTGNAQGVVDAFLHYFNAESDEEREAALAELETNITEAFERVKAAIETGVEMLGKLAEDLKGSDNPTAQALGNLLGGLVDALQWLTEDNMKNVVSALEVLAAFWIAGKGAAMADQIASIVANIETIKLFKAGGAAAGAAGAGAGAASAGGTAAAGAGLGTMALGLGGVGLIAIGADRAIQERLNNQEIRGSEKALEKTLADDGLRDAFMAYLQANRATNDYIDSGEYDYDKEVELVEAEETAAELLRSFEGYQEVLNAYSDWLQEHSYGSDSWEIPDLGADWWDKFFPNSSGAADQNGITKKDLQGFNQLPNQMKLAVQDGVNGVKVTLDGYTVGQLVAPYVSQFIARDLL